MRSALTRTALARPVTSLLLLPRQTAFLPTIRFSSTETSPATETSKTRSYTVGLTNSNSYPVYKHDKAAGSSKFTIVKKIEGNNKALVQDLVQELGVPKENVKINPVTKHIEIKGHHVEQIKEWLSSTLGNPRTPKTLPIEVTA
ncbi:mitochondrial 54S ribosomal protein mL49 [Colletotrichum truncatum]|uniref:Mitochondrial large ribosomal subunit l49 n=1 Tax=Colletotrichum truncatum TaxID=5467 RepID=A0ACC3YYB9_COLTU